MKEPMKSFGKLWAKLNDTDSCALDISYDTLIMVMTNIAAETIKEDLPLIEKWARSYIAITEALCDKIDKYWLASTWADVCVERTSPYIIDDAGNYTYKDEKVIQKEYKQYISAQKKAVNEMMKVLKKMRV